MKTASAVCLGIALAAGVLLGGCGDEKAKRASVAFHLKGVRKAIDRLRREIPQRDLYGMEAATNQMTRTLKGLPARIQRHAGPRAPERIALAEEIANDFAKLRPTLDGLKYKEADVNARLDKIAARIDELEKD